MNVLWITQMDARGEDDAEICKLDVADEMWERLHRIFTPEPRPLKPFQVLITLLDASGDNCICDTPLAISDHRGQWLLRDFFKTPERTWKKVRMSESAHV